MARRLLASLLVLLPWLTAAQTSDDAFYYPYAEPESRFEEPISDSVLFYGSPHLSEDRYGTETRFRLPRVTIRRGAEGFDRERATLCGIDVPYGCFGILRLAGADERIARPLATTADATGSTGPLRRFRFTEEAPLRPFRLALRTATEGYRLGVQASAERAFRGGLHGAFALEGRTGRDARIEGVFTHALTAAARLSYRRSSGLDATLFVALPLSMRGLRSASTEEAFRLTDDRSYNPSWGFQAGKVRNARVRREVLPYAVTALRLPLGGTTIALSAGIVAGVRRTSVLDWYDARTPLPDNYRNLPSWSGDAETDEAWRAADPRYTQIDWDRLIARNRACDGTARYALEDRVERRTDLTLRAAFESPLGAVTLDYGVRASYDRSRFYKEMRDLLGASYLIDVDRWLIDDDTYSNRLENDLRHPSRTIREGDRFGYDYAFERQRASLWLRAVRRGDRWHAEAAFETGAERLYRRGYYEKELFPAAGSYGRSRRIEFAPWCAKATAGYALSPRSTLAATVAAGCESQRPEHLFIQPLYCNRTVEEPAAARFAAARLSFRRTGERLDWEAAAYATRHADGLRTQRYYDDTAGAYADLTLAGIETTVYGVETWAEWRPAYRWTVTATAAWCRSRYTADPQVTVLADADHAAIDLRSASHLHGCRQGGVPQLNASLAVRYYGPRGWSFRLSSGLAADRYVDLAPLRRTDRVARQNGTTPEAFAAFVRQERLPDAFTLDASLFKSIRFERSELWVMLSVRNLTGDEAPAYGYESLRTQRAGRGETALRMPQANRYLYAAPRSWMLSVGWRF